MKVTTRVLTLAVLGAGLVAGVIVLAMWLAGPLDGSAQANGVTPITVGLDMNTTGNSCPNNGTDCTLGTIDYCAQIPAVGDGKVNDGCPIVNVTAETGAQCDNATDDDADTVVNDGCPQVECVAETGAQCANATDDDVDPCVTVDVFLKDLPVNPLGTSGFQYRLDEKDGVHVGTVAAFTHANALINLVIQAGAPNVIDNSQPVGTNIPTWDTSVAELGNIEANPPFTKGVLSRVQIDTTGTAAGVYNLTLDPPGSANPLMVFNSSADDYCDPASPAYVGCTILDGNTTSPQPYGVIAKGVPCPTYADVGVTQVVTGGIDCNGAAPTTMAINTDTDVCLRKTLTNYGPETPVDGTIVAGLTPPAGCTVTPVANPTTFTGLAVGTPQTVDEHYTINCSAPSTHVFIFANNVQPTAPAGVIDTNQDNNIMVSLQFGIAVTATADVEIDSQAFVSPPAEIYAGVDTTVTLRKHLDIASGYGPVDVTVTTTRDLPPAPPTCTAALDEQNPDNPVTLPVSVDVVVDEDWIINCGAEDTDVTFTFHNSVAITTVHVTDTPGNNTADTDLTVDVVPLVGDVACHVDGATGTIVDAGFIFQYVLGLRTGSNVCPLPPNTLYLPAADVNGDTNVDVIDAGFIFRCLLGYHNVFCPAGP